jgi:integrase
MGIAFAKPSTKSLKKEKQTKAERIFTIEELRTLYHAAGKSMQAFMLLALNGGLGNSDIGQLEFRHIQAGWIRYPRPKTAVDRQFPLWKETLKAIDSAKQTKHENLPYVFVTRYGQIWHKEVADSPITKEFAKLLKDAELVQAGRGFYALRHTFRTIADGCRDQVAIDRVMGHSDDSMGANYTHSIEQERLQAVVDHVYQWVKPMFRKPAKKAGAK